MKTISDQLKHQNFLSYNEAKGYLKQFNFKSEKEYYRWAKENKPVFIPYNVRRTYQTKGEWISMGDFLGTNKISCQKYEYYDYNTCVNIARKNFILNQNDWFEFVNKKQDKKIPYHPDRVFKKTNEWLGWSIFLGVPSKRSSGEICIECMLNENSLYFRREWKTVECFYKNKLSFDFAVFADQDSNIPICLIEYNGDQHYEVIAKWGGEEEYKNRQTRDKIKNQWCADKKIPFIILNNKLTQELFKILQIELINIFKKNIEKPKEYFHLNNKKYMDYKDAQQIVQKLKLNSQKEYWEWAKTSNKPVLIPHSPHKVYKNKGWINWGAWLGTNYLVGKDRIYLSFEEAKDWARGNVVDTKQWKQLKEKRPNNIPSAPNLVYKDKGWINWCDFLGSNIYVSFEEAKLWAQQQHIKTSKEWLKLKENRPKNIPSDPCNFYKNKGWVDWYDFLGNINPRKNV